MIYLLAYDIENDRLRTKLADRLLELGLDRIQYSVFMGKAPEALLLESLEALNEKLKPTDRVYLFRLHRQQVADLQSWGQPPEVDELLNAPLAVLL